MTNRVEEHGEGYDRLEKLIQLYKLLYRLADTGITEPYSRGVHEEIVNLLAPKSVDQLIPPGSQVTQDIRNRIAAATLSQWSEQENIWHPIIAGNDWMKQNWFFMERTVARIIEELPEEAAARLHATLQSVRQEDYGRKAQVIKSFLAQEIKTDNVINDTEKTELQSLLG